MYTKIALEFCVAVNVSSLFDCVVVENVLCKRKVVAVWHDKTI